MRPERDEAMVISASRAEFLRNLAEQIDILRAMFPLDEELTLEDDDRLMILRIATEDEDCPEYLEFKLRINAIHQSDQEQTKVHLSCRIDLREPNRSPIFTVDRHPSLCRTTIEMISSDVQEHLRKKEILGARWDITELLNVICELVEIVQSKLEKYDVNLTLVDDRPCPTESVNQTTKFTRSWLRLQSLSSKQKREDLIDYSKKYQITGFVLAGKPALICLESSDPSSIDRYMSEIKTLSWSDVPSFQKKVTEVFREIDVDRQFEEMLEVTDHLKKKGFRNNRNEPADVVRWLRDHHIQESIITNLLGLSSSR